MDNLVELITQNAEGKDLSVLGGTVKLVVDDQTVFVLSLIHISEPTRH